MGSGLDDWIDTYTFTQFGTTGNYSANAILHTLQSTATHALGFSVFISRILATDLSRSHCNFNITREIFLAPSNSFLAFSVAANSETRLDSTRLLSTTVVNSAVLNLLLLLLLSKS
jgi:hypothetical protein